jgi:hypothetical protein
MKLFVSINYVLIADGMVLVEGSGEWEWECREVGVQIGAEAPGWGMGEIGRDAEQREETEEDRQDRGHGGEG